MIAETLAELAVGGKAKITGYTLSGEIRQRLMELGITKGAECQLVRFAPMGDPVEVKVRGYHLSLRKAEAEGILVQPL
jgi:Fe2+ transport system protein FeoA